MSTFSSVVWCRELEIPIINDSRPISSLLPYCGSIFSCPYLSPPFAPFSNRPEYRHNLRFLTSGEFGLRIILSAEIESFGTTVVFTPRCAGSLPHDMTSADGPNDRERLNSHSCLPLSPCLSPLSPAALQASLTRSEGLPPYA